MQKITSCQFWQMGSIILRLENGLHLDDAKNGHHVNSKTVQKFDIMSKIVV